MADEFGTKVMAWAPLAQGKLDIFDNAVLKAVGERHGKTVSQVALRYLMQAGLVVIPKSTHVERMQENINIFDFELTADDMAQIKALDRNERLNNHRDLKLVRWFMTTMK